MTALPPASKRMEGEPLTEEYNWECSVWARGLTEANLRSMASDFKMGNHTPENRDAYYEFKRREENGLLANSESAGSAPKNRRLKRGRTSRYK